jgi:CubicO group peptidase (beta-lactamase class C family)
MYDTQLRGARSYQFDAVIDLLDENLSSGAEVGLSMHIDIDGQTVLDVWGGYQDAERTAVWGRDTITNVWSLSKTVTNTAALMLVAHGELDLDNPVAHYWPRFAQNGKQGVLVRELLSHTAGLSGWEQPVTPDDICDLEKSTAMLAAQAPWWEPGSESGYHLLTQGHLVGELIHRVTGFGLKEFIATQIAAPLDADFRLGVPAHEYHRVADVIAPSYFMRFDRLPEDDVRRKSFTGPSLHAEFANSDRWRQATIGAANGFGNARSVARILRTITLGSDDHGVSLLSPRVTDMIFEQETCGRDLVLDMPINFGIGFALPTPESLPFIPEGRIAFWGGWGGSLGIIDMDRRMTITFVMNKMGNGIVGSETSSRYLQAVYDCLGVPTPRSAAQVR